MVIITKREEGCKSNQTSHDDTAHLNSHLASVNNCLLCVGSSLARTYFPVTARRKKPEEERKYGRNIFEGTILHGHYMRRRLATTEFTKARSRCKSLENDTSDVYRTRVKKIQNDPKYSSSYFKHACLFPV